jgi:hypothetical protein
MAWRVSFTRHTLLDDVQYYIDVSLSTGKVEADRVVSELKAKKYERVRVDLVLTPTP